MAQPDSKPNATVAETGSRSGLALRGALGGVLMGLANLVPGISGGTMLLAAGVYPSFIEAIAEISTLRFRSRSIIVLASIVASAALAILLLAGTIKDLVIDHRWAMYSLFIGLTLGGIPLIWRLARPATPALWGGAAAAFAAMVAMATTEAAGGGGPSVFLLFLSGLAGASAMILPGVSGGYLLLLLGQYESILGAIDLLKTGLVGGGGSTAVMEAAGVVIPVGIGVLVGVVGVSNLLRWLLRRYAKATLGALLGLLVGAVVGLWPFQEALPPQPGDLHNGLRLSASELADIPREDWRLVTFSPSGGHVAGSLALIASGLAVTLAIARLDPDREKPGRLDGEDA